MSLHKVLVEAVVYDAILLVSRYHVLSVTLLLCSQVTQIAATQVEGASSMLIVLLDPVRLAADLAPLCTALKQFLASTRN